jgi:mannose-6-phosphate isomerase
MMHEERPWGYFEVLADEPLFKVKIILVRKAKRLSLQRHRRRSEHWHVVTGRGFASLGESIGELGRIELSPSISLDIPSGALHRVENDGNEDLVMIEIQRGEYFGEDDIERFEDDFGRA